MDAQTGVDITMTQILTPWLLAPDGGGEEWIPWDSRLLGLFS